jgi:hypothetical protein
MPAEKLERALEEKVGALPDPLDADRIDRILTEPEQEALLDAIAADIVDVVPIAGDLVALVRMKQAEDKGIEYPSRPQVIENALSDIPAPFDTVGDVLVSANTMHYLQNERGVPIEALQEDITTDTAEQVDQVIGKLLPGSQG